jgi:hypothetical protein
VLGDPSGPFTIAIGALVGNDTEDTGLAVLRWGAFVYGYLSRSVLTVIRRSIPGVARQKRGAVSSPIVAESDVHRRDHGRLQASFELDYQVNANERARRKGTEGRGSVLRLDLVLAVGARSRRSVRQAWRCFLVTDRVGASDPARSKLHGHEIKRGDATRALHAPGPVIAAQSPGVESPETPEP